MYKEIDIENLSYVIKELLANRGIDNNAKIFDFFYQDIYSVSNPFNIRDMNIFIDRLKEAVEYNEKILIYGDKDADGVTATSIMYNTLKAVSKNVSAFVPTPNTGYGLNSKVIEEYARSGVSLIITVDCGISNVEEVEFARSLGIDIIVTDHHDIPEILPNAYAIFNPKLLNTGFTTTNFCGCAVAFKMMQAFVFSYTKLYNKDIIVLDYEIDKKNNSLKKIKALKATNFVISSDIFAFEINDKKLFLPMHQDDELYYDDGLSEVELLEELASFMFEGDGTILVLTGGEDRLKKLLSMYEKYEIYLPDYENVYDLLKLAENYGNINIKNTKTLIDFALALNVNIYKYENFDHKDLMIKMEVFKRLFFISHKTVEKYLKRESILVLFGTIADIVPVLDENRAYIKCALKELERPPHIRYNVILEKNNLLNTKIDTDTIGWKISPFINAAGRLGNANTSLKLLTAEDEDTALSFAEEVYNMNEERKSMTETSFNRINKYIKEKGYHHNPIIIVKSNDVVPGLTGLIAGKVLNEYGKTAIILHENDEGICTGSIRSVYYENAREMLSFASLYLLKFGGHKNAAGFSLYSKDFDNFIEKILKYLEENPPSEEDTVDIPIYEMVLDFKEINLQLASILEKFEPYGTCNPEPLFKTQNVKVVKIQKIEKNNKIHIKMILEKSNQKQIGVYWNISEEEVEKIANSNYIDIVYKLRVNTFNDNKEVQLLIYEYEIY